MPVITGRKTDSERFAGALRTYCIEALMQDNKALQAGTSHNLGQNFAKAFEIQFQGRDKTLQHAWTTSWGVSTRLIGGVIMTHGDDGGLILPPTIAPHQVVIVPIPRGNWKETVLPRAQAIRDELAARGVRVLIDDRDTQTPGWKFNEWELKGAPLRIELGARDLASGAATVVRRDTGERQQIPRARVTSGIAELLSLVQASLFDSARDERERRTLRDPHCYEELIEYLRDAGGLVEAPWCGSADCEARVKADSAATIRCLPLDEQPERSGACVCCGRAGVSQAVWAQAY